MRTRLTWGVYVIDDRSWQLRSKAMKNRISRILGSVQNLFLRRAHVVNSSPPPRHCSHSPFLHLPHLPRLPLPTSSLSFLTHRHSYTTTPSTPNLCWKCDRDLDEGTSNDNDSRVKFFCPCDKHVILPPSSTHTYFQIMDCPVSYRQNVETLKERFKQLQLRLHPDRFSMASPEEQEYSAGQSALVNRAYSTLLKPYSRGLYLLELNGLVIDERDTLTDAPEFLEEMWEVRESIDNAANSHDVAALLQLQTTNNANLENISDEVAASFDSGDYTGAKEGLARMKYFVNIEESLKDRLDPPP